MSLDESSLSLGGAIGIGISEYNAIASHIKVPAAQVWTGKVLGLGAQCGRPLLPMGIAIYPGHYVAANISQGTPLRIFQERACDCEQDGGLIARLCVLLFGHFLRISP